MGEVNAESPIITPIPGQNDEMGIKEVKLQFLIFLNEITID